MARTTPDSSANLNHKPYAACPRSALDSIQQNHLGREGLRWNDRQLMT